jgi:hypothetical protein
VPRYNSSVTDGRDEAVRGLSGQEVETRPSFNIVGICGACTRRTGFLACQAYPQGIPPRVLTGDIDHRFPLPGDHGLRFELDPAKAYPPTDDATDVAIICKALISEPLLHASLGSKELFHSNLLARICESHPQQAAEILRPWLRPMDHSEPTMVVREYRHVDLLVKFTGYAPLLIENKTFSLPDEDQLIRYATEVAPKLGAGTTLVLLSLTHPGWTDNEFHVGAMTWRWLSYGELAVRISQQFWDQTDFELQIFAHEARLLGLLHNLAWATALDNEYLPFELSHADRTALKAAQLTDAVGKMRAHQLLAEIRHQYRIDDLKPTIMRVNFTRGTPLVEAFWMGPQGDGVGWQMQGDQWRLVMILDSLSGRGEQASDVRAAYAGMQSWFDFDPFYEDLGVPAPPAPTKSGFNKYDPNFVYRYQKLPNGVTFEKLCYLALTYGDLAQRFTFNDGPTAAP